MTQTVILIAAGLALGLPPGCDVQAQEKKFVVVGQVVTAEGKQPMEGVQVSASTGIGSLFVSGETKTDADGKFRLVFPGQGVAIVAVQKAGWHGRHHGLRPQYLLSEQPLNPKDITEEYTNLVVGSPSQVEFQMEPAAQLKGTLLDAGGKPMANARIWLTGQDLRLGGSVIADTRTAPDGSFRVKDVPRSPYRLVLVGDQDRGQTDLELGSIHFRDPVEYTVVATVQEWTPRSSNVSFKVSHGRVP